MHCILCIVAMYNFRLISAQVLFMVLNLIQGQIPILQGPRQCGGAGSPNPLSSSLTPTYNPFTGLFCIPFITLLCRPLYSALFFSWFFPLITFRAKLGLKDALVDPVGPPRAWSPRHLPILPIRGSCPVLIELHLLHFFHLKLFWLWKRQTFITERDPDWFISGSPNWIIFWSSASNLEECPTWKLIIGP